MKIGKWEKRYVYPLGMRWVREAESLLKISEKVGYLGEDDEMAYYGAFRGRRMWGIRKGDVK